MTNIPSRRNIISIEQTASADFVVAVAVVVVVFFLGGGGGGEGWEVLALPFRDR